MKAVQITVYWVFHVHYIVVVKVIAHKLIC